MGDEQQPDEQPQVRSSPYQSPIHTYAGSILLLTNPENELYKLELTLRGLVEIKGQVKLVGMQLLNDEGVRSVLGQAQALVNRVTVMSNLEDREISALMDFLADTLAKDLMLNRVSYDVRNSSTRDRVFYEVLATTFVCLRRAHGEGERKFWKGSTQEITTNMGGAQKKSGFLSKALGWGK
jgi:hypothetical protein